MDRYKVNIKNVPSKGRYEMIIYGEVTGVGDACYINYELTEDVDVLLKLVSARFECAINSILNHEGKQHEQ